MPITITMMAAAETMARDATDQPYVLTSVMKRVKPLSLFPHPLISAINTWLVLYATQQCAYNAIHAITGPPTTHLDPLSTQAIDILHKDLDS